MTVKRIAMIGGAWWLAAALLGAADAGAQQTVQPKFQTTLQPAQAMNPLNPAGRQFPNMGVLRVGSCGGTARPRVSAAPTAAKRAIS